MCGLGLAKFGLSVQQFYEYTPREFSHALKIKGQEETNTYRTAMEAARLVAVNVWNSAGKSLKKTEEDPTKLVPLPWDKERAPKKQSAEDMLAIARTLAIRQNSKFKEKPQ